MVRWQWEWLSHGHASQTSKIQSHTAQLPWQSPPDPWTCSTGNTWLAEIGYIVMSTCTKWMYLLSCSTQANYMYLKIEKNMFKLKWILFEYKKLYKSPLSPKSKVQKGCIYTLNWLNWLLHKFDASERLHVPAWFECKSSHVLLRNWWLAVNSLTLINNLWLS